MEKVVRSVLDPEQKPVQQTPVQVMNANQVQQPQVQEQQQKGKVLRSFKSTNSATKRVYFYVIVGLIVVLAGGLTGRLLARGGGSTGSGKVVMTKDGQVKEAGLGADQFSDEPAEGMLVAGGMENEGTHHLERGMGPEKDVYLFSTSIDLSAFVGKKVKVWGNTLTSQNVPWLMDVGRIQIIE